MTFLAKNTIQAANYALVAKRSTRKENSPKFGLAPQRPPSELVLPSLIADCARERRVRSALYPRTFCLSHLPNLQEFEKDQRKIYKTTVALKSEGSLDPGFDESACLAGKASREHVHQVEGDGGVLGERSQTTGQPHSPRGKASRLGKGEGGETLEGQKRRK